MNILEMQIIYYLITPGDAQKMALFLLETDDFEVEQARYIFCISQERALHDKSVSYVDLMDEVSEKGYLEYLTECSNIYIPEENALSLIQTLKTKSTKRYAMSQCQQIYNEIKSKQLDTIELIAERISITSKSIMTRNPNYEQQDIGKLIQDSINSLSKIGNDICPSGIPSLDAEIKGGLRRADYCVIGARPGIGKSALCLDFLLTSAMAGKWSLMFSTEMPKEHIMLRAVAKMSMVTMDKLTSANGQKMDMEESRRYAKAYGILNKSKMVIYDNKFTASSIIAEYYKQKAMGNDIRLVIVDYIQQLKLEGKYTKKEEAISNITNSFLRLAVDEKITVIVVAQLNRESNPYEKPQLSQIKDCGTIEQDVTTALMLYLDKNDKCITNVFLNKHRNGENYKDITLKFYGPCMAFSDYN